MLCKNYITTQTLGYDDGVWDVTKSSLCIDGRFVRRVEENRLVASNSAQLLTHFIILLLSNRLFSLFSSDGAWFHRIHSEMPR